MNPSASVYKKTIYIVTKQVDQRFIIRQYYAHYVSYIIQNIYEVKNIQQVILCYKNIAWWSCKPVKKVRELSWQIFGNGCGKQRNVAKFWMAPKSPCDVKCKKVVVESSEVSTCEVVPHSPLLCCWEKVWLPRCCCICLHHRGSSI